LVDLGDQAGAVAIEGAVFAELDRPVGQLGEVAPVDAVALVPMGRSCRRF
jgi:Ni,Fe-hydrogenase III small subunit